MEYKIDLHIHTNYSDGQSSPTEVVKRAKEHGYDMIAITDHDGVEGVQEAMIAGEAVDLKVVPGVEFATETVDRIGLHILGYYINTQHQKLQEVLGRLEKKRADRNEKLLAVLAQNGYPVDFSDDVNYVGKPTIAREMVKRGYIKKPMEAFTDTRFFASREIKAIKKEKLQTQNAICVIQEAGGIAVLAHPIKIRGLGEAGSDIFYKGLDILVKEWKARGLKGIECYHPDHTSEQALQFVEIAEKHHLHITKGSDFHGDDFK